MAGPPLHLTLPPGESTTATSHVRVTPAPVGRSRAGARRPKELTPTDIAGTIASGVSAFCLCWLIFARMTDGVGWFAFLICWYVTFVVMSTLVNLDRLGWLVAKDRLATTLVTTGAVVLLAPLVWLVGYIVVRGLVALRPGFFTTDQAGITPVEPSTAGGGLHAVVGTLEQVLLALILSVPLSLAAAIFLNETRSRWRRPVRVFVDAMSGLPSVVAGLFIYATLILPNVKDGKPVLGINGFMASLALALIMVPTITRTIEVVLRLVPDGLRESSLALGASRARTVWSVVLPTARTGVTTAIVLGVARAVGETAPLLFTAFGQDLLNTNAFDGPQESLPLFIYRNVRKPSIAAIDRGFAGALVLLLLVLTLFVIARIAGRDRSKRAKNRRFRLRRERTSP